MRPWGKRRQVKGLALDRAARGYTYAEVSPGTVHWEDGTG